MDFPSLYKRVVRPDAMDGFVMTYWTRKLTSSTATKKVTICDERQNAKLRISIQAERQCSANLELEEEQCELMPSAV